ncbi:MAG: hypothetical protein SFW64_00500 [Alphaproteobacteria bacterium]|nr:hypothetical protein [Alphaproteobacteria bacterium]
MRCASAKQIKKQLKQAQVMAFPVKDYDRMHNLATRWGVSQDDIYYAIENDLLRACVWLPLRWVERGEFKNGKFNYRRHEHNQGFIAIRPEDFRAISSVGRAKLRVFRSVSHEGHILRLAYEPPQPAILVRILSHNGTHDVARGTRENFPPFEK